MLDEPTTGLDPAGMRDMRRLVRRLADGGMTVLLSSHQMAEVEELCDRVAVVRDGRIAYHGSLAALKASAANGFALRTTDDVRARRVALGQPGVEVVEGGEGGLRVRAGEIAVAALSIALAEAGVGIHALVPRGASLEDLFLQLTEGNPAPAPRSGALASAA